MRLKRWLMYFWLLLPLTCISWGFYAHKKINKMAIFTLPQPLMGFYKKHISYIEEKAATPDKLRFLNPQEAPRHYLDVEEFETTIDSIPRSWAKAKEKYGEQKLAKSGQLPWTVYQFYQHLVNAFKKNESAEILRISAYLAHYIADAHVPLHTTNNHNGQLSQQEGIHAFWESTLPEYFGNNYQYSVGKARYIENPLQEIWQIIRESHSKVDSVLMIERQLSVQWNDIDKYSFMRKGTQLFKKPSEKYAKAYQTAMNNMVEKRLQASILAVGSFWYTAWIDAGQPNLQQLKLFEKPIAEDKEDRKLDQLMQQQKIIGREP